MEKRLNRKINAHTQSFKNDIKDKMQNLNLLDNTQARELLQFIFDYPVTEITKIDLQKRKRVKNSVLFCERCCALRANNEQCTRRKKSKLGEQKVDTTKKIEVWAQDIKGIIYFIDKSGNVYDPQDIHQNLTNPNIISKWSKDINGDYTIPEIF